MYRYNSTTEAGFSGRVEGPQVTPVDATYERSLQRDAFRTSQVPRGIFAVSDRIRLLFELADEPRVRLYEGVGGVFGEQQLRQTYAELHLQLGMRDFLAKHVEKAIEDQQARIMREAAAKREEPLYAGGGGWEMD